MRRVLVIAVLSVACLALVAGCDDWNSEKNGHMDVVRARSLRTTRALANNLPEEWRTWFVTARMAARPMEYHYTEMCLADWSLEAFLTDNTDLPELDDNQIDIVIDNLAWKEKKLARERLASRKVGVPTTLPAEEEENP